MLLYVHVPFCVRKCAYCAFHSVTFRPEDAARYTALVTRELRLRMARRASAGVSSVFFGGGTPSVLELGQVEEILQAVRTQCVVTGDAEITVEANPESVTRPGFLPGLRRLGVNRLSLGVQSFQDGVLHMLGRPHGAAEAVAGARTARAAGFDNLSLDLIWGLPGQTLESWRADLHQAVALGPEHLSCYGLSLEDGTPLASRVARGELALPDEDESAGMYMWGSEFLESRGYAQYEISNYARPGRESRHNLGYWAQEDYLGLGPSAVSTLDARRSANPADLDEYAHWVPAGCADMNVEQLSKRTLGQEMVMLALRTRRGLDLERFKVRTGHDFLRFTHPSVEQLCSNGLAGLGSGHFHLTRKGMLLSNSIIGLLLELVDGMPEHTEHV